MLGPFTATIFVQSFSKYKPGPGNRPIKTTNMNRTKFQLLATAAMMMAVASNKPLFDTGPSKVYVKPIAKKDLPRWDVNGHVIYAKDEKTALKYAKKRGLWVPGTIVQPLQTNVNEKDI